MSMKSIEDVMDWISNVSKQQNVLIARAEYDGNFERADRIREHQLAYETCWQVCYDASRGKDVLTKMSNGNTVEFDWDWEERQ